MPIVQPEPRRWSDSAPVAFLVLAGIGLLVASVAIVGFSVFSIAWLVVDVFQHGLTPGSAIALLFVGLFLIPSIFRAFIPAFIRGFVGEMRRNGKDI